ncbi:MAG: type II toxin-antitoxin system HicB family antitoxin [Burkholderiales bacterium]|nr:type II toxin-antitoxin system HicB family antitoxin [Phycisphaerae bacterium]
MAKSNTRTGVKSKGRSKAIDRPFDAGILKRAREIAEKYQIVVHQEDGAYFGRSLEFPHAMNDGKTREEAIGNTIDIITTAIATMLEDGQVPPTPASQDKRDEQVNVRLSRFERAFLEEAARSRGYRGISDFMRAATLATVR